MCGVGHVSKELMGDILGTRNLAKRKGESIIFKQLVVFNVGEGTMTSACDARCFKVLG